MDSKAVSPLIGFVLMLAIIMGLIGIMQAQWVPVWNKEVEAKHLDKLSYEVADMSEAISLAASTGNPAKVVVDAGVRYPNYYVLVSPAKGSGTISAKRLTVTLDGFAKLNSKTISITPQDNGNFSTSAIIFKPNYFYSSSSEVIYEHSAVFREEFSNVVLLSNQSSFSKNKVVLNLVNSSFMSFATTEEATLILYPASSGGVVRFTGKITMECYDSLTAAWWNKTLSSIYGENNVTVNGNVVEVRLTDVDLTINYLFATNGAVVFEQKPQIKYLLPLQREGSHTVQLGDSRDFGVKVLDEMLNPIKDPKVLDNVQVNENCQEKYVISEKGEVWCTFNANSAGGPIIRFSYGTESVNYSISVSSPSSGGGRETFTLKWYDSNKNLITKQPFEWNVSQTSDTTTFYLRVMYNSDPISGASVSFLTNKTDVLGNLPTSTQSDSEGYARVTPKALSNGTAALLGVVGDSASVLNITVSGVGGAAGGFCPAGWSYWREITVQNNVGYVLMDYPVSITLDTQSLINAGKIKSDCSDIRFYDESWSTEMDYWIEDGTCDSASTIIWIKIPTVPASGQTKIYMLYGNSSASGGSNIDSVFSSGTLYYSRKSAGDPNSLAEGINAFYSASDDAGYCQEIIPDFTGVNNGGTCGSSRNIAFWIEAYFYADRNGNWEFRYSPDFGHGGGLYVDGQIIEEDWDDDLWWNYDWNNKNVLEGKINLKEGWHKLFVIGFEGCCDGLQSLQFKKPGEGQDWQYWSTTNLNIKARKFVIPEPSVSMGSENPC